MAYLPIENYGLIGDMHTVALVGLNGSIDWWCYPHFDSPSVFAAILDDNKRGRFQIAPCRDDVREKQYYFPDTNVLITRFLSPDGVGEVEDYMPATPPGYGHGKHQLSWRVKVVRGALPFRVVCQPAFNYARASHDTELRADGAIFRSVDFNLGLATFVKLRQNGDGVTGEFVLNEGQSATFKLSEVDAQPTHLDCPTEDEAKQEFHHTVAYWRNWLSQCRYTGRGGKWCTARPWRSS